jgi:excisionase family DNA binding protein
MSDPLDAKTAQYLDGRIADAVARALAERERAFLGQQAFRPEDAARIIGVSLTTLRQAIRDGTIAHFRLGRVLRIPKYAVDALLQNGSK